MRISAFLVTFFYTAPIVAIEELPEPLSDAVNIECKESSVEKFEANHKARSESFVKSHYAITDDMLIKVAFTENITKKPSKAICYNPVEIMVYGIGEGKIGVGSKSGTSNYGLDACQNILLIPMMLSLIHI